MNLVGGLVAIFCFPINIGFLSSSQLTKSSSSEGWRKTTNQKPSIASYFLVPPFSELRLSTYGGNTRVPRIHGLNSLCRISFRVVGTESPVRYRFFLEKSKELDVICYINVISTTIYIYTYIYIYTQHIDMIWLVVWLPWMDDFPINILGISNHPNWRSHIFQRGGPTANQRCNWMLSNVSWWYYGESLSRLWEFWVVVAVVTASRTSWKFVDQWPINITFSRWWCFSTTYYL